MNLIVLVDDFPLCCPHCNLIILSNSIIISFKCVYEMESVVMC